MNTGTVKIVRPWPAEQPRPRVFGVLGSVLDAALVTETIQRHSIKTIYHAAAYKHVPIVEQNIIEGLHNNVFSTWHTAEAALECRVEIP